MQPGRVISSKEFTWFGNTGCLNVTDILDLQINLLNGRPFTIVSGRTGASMDFHLDKSVPGWEDGWDGECCHYISDNGIKVAVCND